MPVKPGTDTPLLPLPGGCTPVPRKEAYAVHLRALLLEMFHSPGGLNAPLPPVRQLAAAGGHPTDTGVQRRGGDRGTLPRWVQQRNVWGKEVCMPVVWGALAYGAAAQQPLVSGAPELLTRLGGKKPNPRV